MSAPTHAFLEVDGLRLHHLEWAGGAEAAPVVYLHGVTGHAWVWHDVAQELADAGWRVLAFDLRGHGDSQWSPGGDYATARHVQDLEARLDRLGIVKPVLVGASWGGLIALAYASQHADRVAAVALVDVPLSSEQSETDVPERPGEFGSHGAVAAWEREANPHAPPALLELVSAQGTRPASGGSLARKHDPYFLGRWPFRSDDRWGELAALRVPVLVVHAEQSRVVSAEATELAAARAPSARLVSIPDCGHVVPVEQPTALAHALQEFLEQVSR